jgi:flagellar L-ring protein FlgH
VIMMMIRVGLILLGVILVQPPALGQQSSLFHKTPVGGGSLNVPPPPLVELPGRESRSAYDAESYSGGPSMGLANASWTYMPPPPQRKFRKHDIVTIRVDELARMRAEGSSESRRNMLYDAVLKDWISLSGGKLRPAEQAEGEPRVNGLSNQLFRSDASIEARESLAFSVAAHVVDIRPNGNLVLEANKTIWVNDNQFETSMTGECRAQDIAPDNVILSRDLLDLKIRKNDKGELRDGYKRGWLTRWIAELNPF